MRVYDFVIVKGKLPGYFTKNGSMYQSNACSTHIQRVTWHFLQFLLKCKGTTRGGSVVFKMKWFKKFNLKWMAQFMHIFWRFRRVIFLHFISQDLQATAPSLWTATSLTRGIWPKSRLRRDGCDCWNRGVKRSPVSSATTCQKRPTTSIPSTSMCRSPLRPWSASPWRGLS